MLALPRITQYSLPGGLLTLRAGLTRLNRASFAWRHRMIQATVDDRRTRRRGPVGSGLRCTPNRVSGYRAHAPRKRLPVESLRSSGSARAGGEQCEILAA